MPGTWAHTASRRHAKTAQVTADLASTVSYRAPLNHERMMPDDIVYRCGVGPAFDRRAGLSGSVVASSWNVALVAPTAGGDEPAGLQVREPSPLAGRGCRAALGRRAGQRGLLLALRTMRGREGAVGAQADQPNASRSTSIAASSAGIDQGVAGQGCSSAPTRVSVRSLQNAMRSRTRSASSSGSG